MKYIILAVAITAITSTGAFAQRITGSDTCLPVSQRGAEEFMRANPSASVTVTGGGSGVGISALVEGTTDIAQSSRKISFGERQRLQQSGKTPVEVIVAYDALAIVVHPQNRVSNLTREQLEGIFTGRIRNWSEVGGDNMPIVPYARETSSGTYEFIREFVLRNRNYMNGIMSMPASGAVIQSISQTRGAIGYVGLAYVNSNVKAVNVSYDGGQTFVAPTVANAINETYPIVRPLIYYYVTGTETVVRPFIDFLLSPAGQRIIADVGFIPVN
jgi:phosphate transport system substrate-binding protein